MEMNHKSLVFVLVLLSGFGGVLCFGIHRKDVEYYLFSNNNPNPHTGIKNHYLNPVDIARNKNCRTVFLVHGWLEDRNRDWYARMTEAYLSRTDVKYQVVQVDWSAGSKQLYPLSKMYTENVGNYIGHFILRLWVLFGVPLENFEITGHSLGAHVAGFAGQKIYEMSGLKLRRITGLDPAGPLFEWNLVSKNGRLSKDDAEVVAVVHTDKNVFGFSGSCGSIDFFPNGGGFIQPGCLKFNIFHTVPCSHFRSFQFFEEALRYNKIIGTKCSSYLWYEMGWCNGNQQIRLGGDIYFNQTGKFYFDTNAVEPFSKDSK